MVADHHFFFILYIGDVLQIIVLPYLHGHPHVLFQEDNARPYFARRNMEFLHETGFNVLLWLPCSSDLIPIERGISWGENC